MIREEQNLFILDTRNTTYAFRVTQTGHLEHLYYGRKITLDADSAQALFEKHSFAPGNTNVYDNEHTDFSLEDIKLEMSSYGKGDIREPFVELVHADGSLTCDFLYEDHKIIDGKEALKTLPSSYDETGNAKQLTVVLSDKQYNIKLELYYYVYEDCDVISRSARLINESAKTVCVERLMSAQLDFDMQDFSFITFNGAWAREMRRTDVRMTSGRHINSSLTGTSSNRANPFVMLALDNTSEDAGECYGFNLIYSGNHYEAVEVSGYGKTRIVTGINPATFRWRLESGENFEAPEAALSYSHEGYNGLSQNMHRFVREHIVRGEWKKKTRPVLLNSWEAAYFDFTEKKLLSLAKEGKEAGIELFVMDDG